MALKFDRRHFFTIAIIIGALLSAVAAPAAVQMTTGIRIVEQNGSTADCGSKAKTALSAFLQNTSESTPGNGEWIASGAVGVNGPSTAAASIRCIPVGTGYVAIFTCAVQAPGSGFGAPDLCIAVANKFQGKPAKPLPLPPTPTPLPTGCTTTNLVGEWQSNDNPGLTFKMDVEGGLVDNQGVSGSWAMNGNSVTLTYYGNHTLTLSSDGKHLSGGGYNLTRKC